MKVKDTTIYPLTTNDAPIDLTTAGSFEGPNSGKVKDLKLTVLEEERPLPVIVIPGTVGNKHGRKGTKHAIDEETTFSEIIRDDSSQKNHGDNDSLRLSVVSGLDSEVGSKYESKLIPKLVKMLDHGCAWIEGNIWLQNVEALSTLLITSDSTTTSHNYTYQEESFRQLECSGESTSKEVLIDSMLSNSSKVYGIDQEESTVHSKIDDDLGAETSFPEASMNLSLKDDVAMAGSKASNSERALKQSSFEMASLLDANVQSSGLSNYTPAEIGLDNTEEEGRNVGNHEAEDASTSHTKGMVACPRKVILHNQNAAKPDHEGCYDQPIPLEEPDPVLGVHDESSDEPYGFEDEDEEYAALIEDYLSTDFIFEDKNLDDVSRDLPLDICRDIESFRPDEEKTGLPNAAGEALFAESILSQNQGMTTCHSILDLPIIMENDNKRSNGCDSHRVPRDPSPCERHQDVYEREMPRPNWLEIDRIRANGNNFVPRDRGEEAEQRVEIINLVGGLDLWRKTDFRSPIED